MVVSLRPAELWGSLVPKSNPPPKTSGVVPNWFIVAAVFVSSSAEESTNVAINGGKWNGWRDCRARLLGTRWGTSTVKIWRGGMRQRSGAPPPPLIPNSQMPRQPTPAKPRQKNYVFLQCTNKTPKKGTAHNQPLFGRAKRPTDQEHQLIIMAPVNGSSIFDNIYDTDEDEDDNEDTDRATPPTTNGQTTTPATIPTAAPAAVQQAPSAVVARTRIAYKRTQKKIMEHDSGLSAFKKLIHSTVVPYAKFVSQDDDLKSASNSDTFFLFCHGFAGDDEDKLVEARKRWDKHRNKVRTIVREKRGSMVDTMKNAFTGM